MLSGYKLMMNIYMVMEQILFMLIKMYL